MNKPYSSILFARNLREFRTALGLTQHDVAQKLNVAITTVSGWELGRQPSFYQLDKLAELYKVPLSHFYRNSIDHCGIEAKIPLSGANAFIDAILSSTNTELHIVSKINDSIVFRIVQHS